MSHAVPCLKCGQVHQTEDATGEYPGSAARSRACPASDLEGWRPIKGDARILTAPPAIDIEQPAPIANGQPAVWPLVIADMTARDGVGRERYGTPLQPHNGRDALMDAYAEALDLSVYLRQAIFERDGK